MSNKKRYGNYVTVGIDDETKEAIKKMAERQLTSLANITRILITKHIELLEMEESK